MEVVFVVLVDTADREEILVVGRLAEPDATTGADDDTKATACEARIEGFREDTRARRMQIADEAERRFERKVAWGARCGDAGTVFTQRRCQCVDPREAALLGDDLPA